MACAGEKDDFASFSRVNSLLLNTPSPLRNVPVRIYIPSSPSDMTDTTPGSLKVVQTLIPPRLPNRKCPPPPPLLHVHPPSPSALCRLLSWGALQFKLTLPGGTGKGRSKP
jgi:hypothetical protein